MKTTRGQKDIAGKFKEGCLEDLLLIVAEWNEEASEKGLFMVLLENDVRIQDVIDSLAEKLDQGWETDIQSREEAFTAARVYIKLVLVPGSNAFQVFHPHLYEKVLDYMKQYAVLAVKHNESFESSVRSRSSSSVRGSQGKRKASKKRRRSSTDEVEEDARPSLAQQDVPRLRENLHILLQDIVTLLDKFPLKSSAVSVFQTIQVLVQLTRQEVLTFDCNFENSASLDPLCIPALAYRGLQLMWSEKHGNLTSLMESTFKNLLPNLLMLEDDRRMATINKHWQAIQTQTTRFVCHLVQQFGESCLGTVRSLVQHMCMGVPDKAEYRARVAEAVLTIVKSLPLENYCSIIQWICKLSRHVEVASRSFATEVAALFLSSPLRPVTEDLAPDLTPYATYKILLETVYKKCSDTAPSVRTKALSYIAVCLKSRDEQLMDSLRDIIVPGFSTLNTGPQSIVNTPGTTLVPQSMVNTPGTSVEAEASSDLSSIEGLFSLLRIRSRDDKVLVRKAALNALEYAVKFEMDSYSRQNVRVLQEHCRDPGLSARKQAMLSLTELLIERPDDEFLLLGWLNEALPLIDDKEQTLADRCKEILEELLLLNIVKHNRSRAKPHQLAWRMLDILSDPTKGNERGYLTLACKLWGEKGKITQGLTTALLSHIGTENDAANRVDPDHAALIGSTLFAKAFLSVCSIEVQQWMLVVLVFIAKHLTSDDRAELIDDLKSHLLGYQMPVELISGAIKTLSTLCAVQAEKTKNPSEQKEWLGQLMRATDSYLSRVLLESRDTAIDEEKLGCHLCTLGDVALIYPGRLPERAILMVKSILASSCVTSVPVTQGKEAENGKDADQSMESQDSQGSAGSQRTQSSQASSQASSQPLSQFGGSNMPSKIRSMAFVTLGKICLKKHSLAKKYVGAMVRELETSTEPGIRNNLMIILCDLARRYTSVGNQVIGHVFACLRDSSAFVRRQTLMLITELLQEDYLKWKADLFYRFLACILDDVEDTRQYAETCLEQLLARKSSLFVSHFVEAVYVYNDCMDHKTYNKYPQSKGTYHFKGEENKMKRRKIYNFLLRNMQDEHKFTAMNKLCQEVLGAVVDDILPLNNNTSPVLKDALTILSCKEIKLSVLRDQTMGEDLESTEEITMNVTETVKKVIIGKVMKNNLSQIVIPTVLSLKHVLDKKRSPLLRELFMYFRVLMKDFKTEVEEALTEHHGLAKEIEFDMRKFEEQQRQQQQEMQQETAMSVVQQGTSVATAQQQASPGSKSTPRPSTPRPATSRPSTPRPSTQRPSTPRPAMRNGTPRPATPRLTPGSSRASPGMSRGSPRLATPAAREPHLATMTLVNLILKRMEGDTGSPKVNKTPQPTSPGSNSSPGESRDTLSLEGMPTTALRTRSRAFRAISTPSVAIDNITFLANGRTGPSPIPKHMARTVYDETDPSLTHPRSTPASPKTVVPLNVPPEAIARPAASDVTPKAPAAAANQKGRGGDQSPAKQTSDQCTSPRPKRGRWAKKR